MLTIAGGVILGLLAFSWIMKKDSSDEMSIWEYTSLSPDDRRTEDRKVKWLYIKAILGLILLTGGILWVATSLIS